VPVELFFIIISLEQTLRKWMIFYFGGKVMANESHCEHNYRCLSQL